eukprot:1007306-Rhodomonas_salina.1
MTWICRGLRLCHTKPARTPSHHCCRSQPPSEAVTGHLCTGNIVDTVGLSRTRGLGADTSCLSPDP